MFLKVRHRPFGFVGSTNVTGLQQRWKGGEETEVTHTSQEGGDTELAVIKKIIELP